MLSISDEGIEARLAELAERDKTDENALSDTELFELASLNAFTNRDWDAIPTLERAADRNPNNPSVLLMWCYWAWVDSRALGGGAGRNEFREQIHNTLNRISRIDPARQGDVEYLTGLNMENEDPEPDWNTVATHYRRSTELAPDWVANWQSLGYALERLGLYSEAEESLRKALNNVSERDPDWTIDRDNYEVWITGRGGGEYLKKVIQEHIVKLVEKQRRQQQRMSIGQPSRPSHFLYSHPSRGSEMRCIVYKKGYKYQLVSDYSISVDIKPPLNAYTDYIDLTIEGDLLIKKGYAWDGPSGPTLDTRNFMRGSMVHDALYQLMRDGHLKKEVAREPADRLLQEMCKEDGMSALRAWWVYKGLHWFGDPAADPSNTRPFIEAPKLSDKQ